MNNNTFLRALALAGLASLLVAPAALALDVTFDDGTTSVTIVDDGPGDLNTIDPGVLDFDLTGAPVGGVLSGAGRVTGGSGPIGAGLRLGGPPLGTGVLQNVGVASATFTVTITSSAFTQGPPLGWAVDYEADFDDPTLGPVSSAGGSLELTMNQSTTPVSLATVSQPAIASPTSFYDGERGTDPTFAAAEIRLTYAVDLGADDRVVLGDLENTYAIAGTVFNQDYKCMDRMNNDCGKVADAAGKVDAKCVSTQYKLGGGDATLCVDDPLGVKEDARESRLLDDYVTYCPVVPAWGVNGATCCEGGANDGALCDVDLLDCPDGGCIAGACISYASELSPNDMMHELFGASVMVSATSGKCQYDLAKAAAKALKERWKVFRTCKRANATLIPDDASLVTTCLGPPQADPSAKVFKADAKVGRAVEKCIDRGFTPVGAEFGGACTAVADLLFPACVAERTQCAFCRGVNVADDIAPPLDCDLFDDATANLSCP